MDTIFATATAPIKSGVAVIRISGSGAPGVLQALTRKSLLAPRSMYLSKLYNPANNELIDEALVVWFKGPASFTGEDVAELYVHGSRAVIAEMLACLGHMAGLRMAEPGEFSRRAFLNGKMDLTQAEGLADLIDAETKMQAQAALRQKQGNLGRLYEQWRKEILTSLAYLEAYIDFPDEEIPNNVTKLIASNVNNLLVSLKSHLNDGQRGERLRHGFNVVIIGPPNVGKSTLLNILSGRELAIVSQHAGTTRDVIEAHLDLGGYPVIIADTAGIRENAGEIEAEGIRRARDRAQTADLRILIIDAEFACNQEYISSLLLDFSAIVARNTLIVVNKIDLLADKNILPNIADFVTIFAIFNSGEGIDEIIDFIKNSAEETIGFSTEPLITRERHRALVRNAATDLENFSFNKPIELACEDLRLAANSIGKITGRIDVEEVLDKIFSSFCIGK